MWWSFLLVVFVAYSILGWTLFFMQKSFMYRPVQQVLYDPADIDLAYEKVVLNTEDGLKLSGWYVPADKPTGTVLMCHGNAGNITHRLDTINILNEMNLNCLVFDYRGYGLSQGTPTEEGTYLDAMAAWEYLTKRKGFSPDEIIIFGRSLGAAIASKLALKTNPRSLVLESAFTSYVDIGKKFYPYLPVRLFAKYKYPTIDHVRQVSCPVLFIHSRNDELIPFEFSLRLYDAAKEPKEFVEIIGCHNDGFLFSGDLYKQGWLDFIQEHSCCISKQRKRSV